MRLRWLMGIAVLAGLAGNGRVDHADAAETMPAARGGVSAEVGKAIRELGDDRMTVREEASKRLLGIGSAAVPALQEAAKSPDPEVSIRAERLLRDISAGITADTPEDAAALLRAYARADHAERMTLIQQSAELGEQGLVVLLRLSENETDPELVKVFQERLFAHSHAVLRTLLARGYYAQAERFMEAGRRSENMDAVRDWAAHSVLRGRYESERKRLEAELKRPASGPVDPQRNLQVALAYLHRAHGDLGLAAVAARESGDDTVAYGMMVEQGDWKALTAWAGDPKLNSMFAYQAKAVRALAAYYAGDQAKYESWLEETRAEAKKSGHLDGRYAWVMAFLNRPEESTAGWMNDGYWANAVDILAARGMYFAALELVEQGKREGCKNLPEVLVKQALVFYGLGEAEKARAILDEVGAGIVKELAAAKNAPAPTTAGAEPTGWKLNEMIGQVAAAYTVVGEKDKGLALAARFLEQYAVTFPPKRYCRMFYSMYGENSDAAEVFFVLLHASRPGMAVVDTLKAVSGMCGGEIKDEKLEGLAKEIFEEVKLREQTEAPLKDRGQDGDSEFYSPEARLERRRWVGGRLRQVLEAAGLKGAFVEELRKECPRESRDRGSVLREEGKAALKSKDWAKAAKVYGELAEVQKNDWPTYLEGYALLQAGMKEEGEFLERRADLLMLAASDERYLLAGAASEAGLWDVAIWSYERLMAFGEPLDVYWINAATYLASSGKLEAGRAARLEEGFVIAHTGGSSSFISTRLDIAFMVAKDQHDFAAREAAARKDWPRVVKEAEAALEIYPGDSDKSAEWVAVLDGAGRKADADALVEKQVKYFEGVLTKYPRAANLHNSMAWLCAKTGRHLDEGLRHAETATGYFPKSAAFLDTLAEVHFARGEFKEAVEVEKRAVELEPGWQLIKDSLRRFEQAAAQGRP